MADKVTVHLRAVGDAPILKNKKYTLDASHDIAWLTQTMRNKLLKLEPSQSLFLYISQTFSPSPDHTLDVLRNSYSLEQSNELVIHYSTTQAWGWPIRPLASFPAHHNSFLLPICDLYIFMSPYPFEVVNECCDKVMVHNCIFSLLAWSLWTLVISSIKKFNFAFLLRLTNSFDLCLWLRMLCIISLLLIVLLKIL